MKVSVTLPYDDSAPSDYPQLHYANPLSEQEEGVDNGKISSGVKWSWICMKFKTDLWVLSSDQRLPLDLLSMCLYTINQPMGPLYIFY